MVLTTPKTFGSPNVKGGWEKGTAQRWCCICSHPAGGAQTPLHGRFVMDWGFLDQETGKWQQQRARARWWHPHALRIREEVPGLGTGMDPLLQPAPAQAEPWQLCCCFIKRAGKVQALTCLPSAAGSWGAAPKLQWGDTWWNMAC